MSVFKNFNLYRETKLELRAVGFKTANQTNYANPVTAVTTTATFGADLEDPLLSASPRTTGAYFLIDPTQKAGNSRN